MKFIVINKNGNKFWYYFQSPFLKPSKKKNKLTFLCTKNNNVKEL